VIFKKFFCVILALTLILPFSGCSNTDESYLYFELPELPTTFDPQVAEKDSELIIIKNIFEGLLRKDSNGKIVNGVAEDFTKKGNTYTFKIRENAIWNNGDPLTAQDFVFAFKRAVNPATKAPFASRLFCIKNAEKINNGALSVDKLGVKAVDDKTLKITLSKNDELFLENLTTSIAMPCNESFFNQSGGKYGLIRDKITGNGSYRLTKWNKTSFGIRLYRNENYSGSFKAKNAAVFITCNPQEDITEKLRENKIDLAFIDSSLSDTMKEEGFKTKECQNICWFMTFDNTLPKNIRKSLMMLVGENVYIENCPSGYSPATSILPGVFDKKPNSKGITKYNLSGAKSLYNSEVKNLENNKFPANITLYYFDNKAIKPVVTDIVGHWQGNLSAFVNIESVTDSKNLLTELENQSLPISFFPVKAGSRNLREYFKNFGINYSSANLNNTQENLLESKNIIPVLFQNTTVCYSEKIKEIHISNSDTIIDFSMIIKEK